MLIQTDNSMAMGVTNTILPKAMKAMDMQFHWLRDREQQKQYQHMWQPEATKLANYWIKHHSAAHHMTMRLEIVSLQTQKTIIQPRVSTKDKTVSNTCCKGELEKGNPGLGGIRNPKNDY